MTKNNLAGHLKWLLKQGPSLYPSLTAELPNIDHSRAPTSDQTVENPAVNTTRLQPTDVSAPQNPTNNGAPVKNDTDTDADGDTDMARLALAPGSSGKPRMLSLINNRSQASKTPSNDNVEESPTRQRKAPRQNITKGMPVDIGRKYIGINDTRIAKPQDNFFSSARKTPSRKLDVKSPIPDIDAIDLTGDVGHPNTSSETAEEFDEPRRLWTEDAAFRRSPEEKRGKKRKSDEYKSDLFSPKRHPPKVRSPANLEKPDKKTSAKITASPTMPRTKPGCPSPLANPPRRESPRVSRKSVNRVIADSDDDDDDLFDWLPGDESIMEDDQPLYPQLPKEDENSEAETLPKRKTHDPSPSKAKSTPAPKDERPTRQVPAAVPTHGFSPFPPSSRSQDKRDPDVVNFLALPNRSLERLISRIKDTIKKNSEIVYQQAMEGFPAPEVVAENKTLVSRVEAIELLQQQKAAHDTRASEKESLKKALMQVISRGGDPQSMPRELAKSREIATEQEEIEAKIHELLPLADVLGLNADSSDLKTPRPDSPGLTRSPQATHSHVAHSPRTNSFMQDTSVGGHSLFKSPGPEANRNAPRTDLQPPASRSFPAPTKERTAPSPFDYDESLMSDDDDCFTRNMGSPAPPTGDGDEFDFDDADVEMLEAAESFDGPSAPADRSDPMPRKVFAETSGNASRTSPTKKPSAHLPLWNNHPWSKDVRTVLKDKFQLRGFRMNQLEAIDATLAGKDTFVLMPTGGGKSLCYQLPSIVNSGSTKGVTIVISPLLSLMQDQVSHLQRLNIKAFLVNGETDASERKRILSILSRTGADEHIELIYITPEMVSKNQSLINCLEKLHRNRRLARIVIDEAHCVSQWGHDFRPDYKELGEFRARFPGVPMMALTATATENVKVDVIHNLKMQNCQVLSQSFNRPNLTYEVRQKQKGGGLLESIASTIKESWANKSGIIYCLSRKACETLASDLKKKHGLKAAHYHAGLESDKRAQIQRDWQSGKHHVIVATIAFGMGIDKPDVRFVIHHTIPKSLEGYYQETGRAGRDGKRSGCYLYYGYGDTASIKRMIDQGEGSNEQKARQYQMLRNVVQYCENKTDCRRMQILGYFNEYFRREDCNASCDNCTSDSTFEVHDYSQYAAAAIKIVRHFEHGMEEPENVTLLHCVDIFRGNDKKIKQPSHRKIPGYGSGSELELGEAERLFYRLLGEEALWEKNVMNRRNFTNQYIKLGPRAWEFENGRRPMKLHVRVSPKAKKPSRPNRANRTGAGDEYPLSTNVSSPVQSANRRRLARYRYENGSDEDSDDDKDSDGFEQIRVAGKPRHAKARQLGPPITNDPTWENLEYFHRIVAEEFICLAETQFKDVRSSLQLTHRKQPLIPTTGNDGKKSSRPAILNKCPA